MVRSNDHRKKKQVVILTTVNAASNGDVIPHCYLGPDPNATVHNLGFNVESFIVGNIDGRLMPGVSRGLDAVAVNTLEPRLTNGSGLGITPLYLNSESGLAYFDRNGYYGNSVPSCIPDKLLDLWYDNAQWRDIGLVQGLKPYPLCGKDPVRHDNTTWRDYALEEAIAHRSQKKKKKHCHH
jgi:hypothetical protein